MDKENNISKYDLDELFKRYIEEKDKAFNEYQNVSGAVAKRRAFDKYAIAAEAASSAFIYQAYDLISHVLKDNEILRNRVRQNNINAWDVVCGITRGESKQLSDKKSLGGK